MANVCQPMLEDRLLHSANRVVRWSAITAFIMVRGLSRRWAVGLMLTWIVGVPAFCSDLPFGYGSCPTVVTELQIKRLEESLIAYAAKHEGRFPTTAEGLLVAKRYLPGNQIPVDAWGNHFLYYGPGIHSDNPYEIISLGAEVGESDDIRSWKIGQPLTTH